MQTQQTRDVLISIYMDWRNNYITVARYAECNALSERQAADLIALATAVYLSEHPDR